MGSLASEVSGGQMKLLELCRGLMGEPKILLLDEPTAGVFPKLAREIFGRITRLQKEFGMTFLIVGHRLDLLFVHVDKVFVMDYSKIILEGAPEKIKGDKVLIDIYLGE